MLKSLLPTSKGQWIETRFVWVDLYSGAIKSLLKILCWTFSSLFEIDWMYHFSSPHISTVNKTEWNLRVRRLDESFPSLDTIYNLWPLFKLRATYDKHSCRRNILYMQLFRSSTDGSKLFHITVLNLTEKHLLMRV